jgi:hypothetical protein
VPARSAHADHRGRTAVTALVDEDVHVGTTVTAGTEAALEQLVAAGAAEQTWPTSIVLAESMLTHARQLHPEEWVSAKYSSLSVRYITATFDDP